MSCECENVMLIGDFNHTVENKNLEVFMIHLNTLAFNLLVEVSLS